MYINEIELYEEIKHKYLPAERIYYLTVYEEGIEIHEVDDYLKFTTFVSQEEDDDLERAILNKKVLHLKINGGKPLKVKITSCSKKSDTSIREILLKVIV